jgi:GntR family transcriptional regulator/MocR family aminotransferase
MVTEIATAGRPPEPPGYVRLSLDLLSVDRASAEPIHRQIYTALRNHILAGRLPPHTLLPSTRALAEELRIGRNTVIAAYDQLLAEGFVEARTGSGTWVAPIREPRQVLPAAPTIPTERRLSRRGAVLAEGGQPIRSAAPLSLHPGMPDVEGFPFSVWSNLIARNARRSDEVMRGVVETGGYPPLRHAIAETIGVSRGIDCSPEQIIVVGGSRTGLDLIARLLIDEGDAVWLEEPGSCAARATLLAAGARLAPLRVDAAGWRLEAAALPAPRLVYVTPSCQWPLGRTMRIEERLQLLDLAGRNVAWVVEDDYDGEFRLRGRSVPALRALDRGERVIYVGAFGRTLPPALRIGYLIVPEPLAPAFARALSVTGQAAPLVLQAAVADFIRQGYFATHLKRMRRLCQRRQASFALACAAELAGWVELSEHESGMQLLARIRRPLEDTAVAAEALKDGVDVQVISSSYFSDPPEHGLLLAHAGLDDRQTLRALQLLRGAFERLAGAAPPPIDQAARASSPG